MALTVAEREKTYHNRLKEKKAKYTEFKRKDRERTVRKRASMNFKQNEGFVKNHRIAQRRYRQKLNKDNTIQTKFF